MRAPGETEAHWLLSAYDVAAQ